MAKDNRKVGGTDRLKNIAIRPIRRTKQTEPLKEYIEQQRLRNMSSKTCTKSFESEKKKNSKSDDGLLDCGCVICSKIFSSSGKLLKSTQHRMIKYILDELFILADTPTNPKPQLTSTSLSLLHLCPDCFKTADLVMDYKSQLKQLQEDIGKLSQNFKTFAVKAIENEPSHRRSELDVLVYEIRNFIGKSQQFTETCDFPSKSSLCDEGDLHETKIYSHLSSKDDFDVNLEVEISSATATKPDPINIHKEPPTFENLNAVIEEENCGYSGNPEQNAPFEEEIKIEVMETNNEHSAYAFCPFFLEKGAAIATTVEQELEYVEIDNPPILSSLKDLSLTITKPQIQPDDKEATGKEKPTGQSHTSKKEECKIDNTNPENEPSIISDELNPQTRSQLEDKTTSATIDNSKEKCVNLLEYCQRAMGEWVFMDFKQAELINVEYFVPLFYPEDESLDTEILELKVESIMAPLVESVYIPPEEKPLLKCIRLTTTQIMADAHEEQDIVNCKTFFEDSNPRFYTSIDPKNPDGELSDEEKKKHALEIQNQILLTLNQKKKETIYWACRLRYRSEAIILGILESRPLLKTQGIKNWVLPSGAMIPLEDLSLGMLEVAPKCITLVQTRMYQNNGGIVAGSTVIPSLRKIYDNTSTVKIRRYEPGVGCIMHHFILITEDPISKKKYVFDPTGIQYFLRGPNDALVVHGEWDEYVKMWSDFGKIVGTDLELNKWPKEKYDILYHGAYFLGNSLQYKFIDRLAFLLVKYLGRRSCSFCGRIEGEHKENPFPHKRYKHVSIMLLNCSKCKSVQYCDSTCQKSDWKNHKANCE